MSLGKTPGGNVRTWIGQPLRTLFFFPSVEFSRWVAEGTPCGPGTTTRIFSAPPTDVLMLLIGGRWDHQLRESVLQQLHAFEWVDDHIPHSPFAGFNLASLLLQRWTQADYVPNVLVFVFAFRAEG